VAAIAMKKRAAAVWWGRSLWLIKRLLGSVAKNLKLSKLKDT
jgi:hypothetical protein